MAQVSYRSSGFPEVTFEVGDVVRLLSGRKPQRVERITYRQGVQYLECIYLNSIQYKSWSGELCMERPRISSDYVLLQAEPSSIQQKEDISMTKLYQTKGEKPEFGTHIATNSLGLLVLEMKGTGDVKTFKKDEVEEVVPYTVSLRLLNQPGKSVIHVQLPKDSVGQGDLVLMSGNIYAVSALNTKSSAGMPKTVRVFKGTTIGSGGDENSTDEF